MEVEYMIIFETKGKKRKVIKTANNFLLTEIKGKCKNTKETVKNFLLHKNNVLAG